MPCPTPIIRRHPGFEDSHHHVPCGTCSHCVAVKVRTFTGACMMHTAQDSRTCGDALPQFVTLTYRPRDRPMVESTPTELGSDWEPHPNARQDVHELYDKDPAKAQRNTKDLRG